VALLELPYEPLELTNLVLQYALVNPYYSQLVVNACLELQGVGAGKPTWAFVEWDPTCSSCYYAYYDFWFLNDPAFYSTNTAAQ
jgi:hypothetical protein